MAEKVNHPKHYGNAGDGKSGEFETIKVIKAYGFAEGFCYGNVLKYTMRASTHGTEVEDLQKARWYLDYLIKMKGAK